MNVGHFYAVIYIRVEKMDYALTTDEVQKLVPDLKLVLYPDLGKLRELPRKTLLLYFDNPMGGHWTLLLRRGARDIEVFDSYGVKPDQEFEWIGREKRRANGQPKNWLTQKLIKFDKVEYNPYKFQADSGEQEIATCGRWCALRALFSDLTIDEFWAMINHYAGALKVSRDELAVMMTAPALGK